MNYKEIKLYAGAAEVVITPPVGLELTGWAARAAGDNFSRFVHDDLFVRALTLACAGKAWIYVIADVASIDPVAAEQIRRGIAEATGLDPHAIMVGATHCHSAPGLHTVALTCSHMDFLRRSVQSNGRAQDTAVAMPSTGSSFTGTIKRKINADWRGEFIRRAVAVGIRAWQGLLPAEVAFSEENVPGVASSRRVRLSDGSWADPRRETPRGAVVVSRTEPDNTIRLMLVRERSSRRPLAALINFGCHPWIFSGSGISADLAGAVCRKAAAQWTSAGGAPVVLFSTGPEGDVTAIWNIDVENVWKSRPGETTEESLHRREQAFTRELDRLGDILVHGAMSAIAAARDWDDQPQIDAERLLVSLPLKDGYVTPPEILLADWQKSAPAGRHLTELQGLRAGAGVILGLPGEPFSAIGKAIRRKTHFKSLLIAALTNDCGEVVYVPDRQAYAEGGYEPDTFPLASGCGEIMIKQAVGLLGSIYSRTKK
ncbi:MAG: hypothetical protein Q7J98_02840 [Kiritimatiellia bacterium]|nr:hypothetical protein [Kiritimatiellia bacterium]